MGSGSAQTLREVFRKTRCGRSEREQCFLFHVLKVHSSGIYCKPAHFSSSFTSADEGLHVT